MSETRRNIIVGLTTVVGLAGFGALLLFFGAMPFMMERGYIVTIESPTAGGVRPGARIDFAGIDIGRIIAVRRVGVSGESVAMEALIHEGELLPAQCVAQLSSPPLGGSAKVSFVLPAEVEPNGEILPVDGSAVVYAEIMPSIGEISRNFRAVMTEAMGTLQGMGDSIHDLTDAWTQVGKNMAELTKIQSLEAVDQGEIDGNLATVLARADRTIREVEKAFQGINRYVHDEQLRENLTQTTGNARQLSENLIVSVEELKDELQGSVKQLTGRYVALADDFSGAARSLQIFLDQANEGDGTIGKLMSDPALYENLNDAAVRLQRALDEIRLTVQKWKAEGISIQF